MSLKEIYAAKLQRINEAAMNLMILNVRKPHKANVSTRSVLDTVVQARKAYDKLQAL